MSGPKLHHYVPQFHLRRFADASGRLWLWDRDADRVFPSGPRSVAAERHFYFHDGLNEAGHDPLTLEAQFSSLEGNVAMVTNQWLEWIRAGGLGDQIWIPEENRAEVSLFLAVQLVRTAETRSILEVIAHREGAPLGERDLRRAHLDVIWDEELVTGLKERFHDSIWVFSRTCSAVPLVTSDNPLALRSGDNRMWLKVGAFGEGTYVNFALSPDVILYCYPRESRWKSLERFDCRISPVELDEGLTRNENTAHVFLASRFVISPTSDFQAERAFASTISYPDPIQLPIRSD